MLYIFYILALTRLEHYFYTQHFFHACMIHIGMIIKAELDKQERSVTWFARKLYCDRTNVYKIFKRKSIDTELLLRISVILNTNFFQYYENAYQEILKSDPEM